MSITINKQTLAVDRPVFIIAEACDNHLGDIQVAREMIREAKAAGADAIKFQHHLPEEEMLPDVPSSDNFDEPLFDFLKKYALTLEQHCILKRYCDEVGITYLCTPFSWKAAQEIEGLVPAFKIGSGEMTDTPTLSRIGVFGKPMIVSTGMSNFGEIEKTYQLLSGLGVPLVLMNCCSEYPPIYEDLNLGVIPEMIKRFPRALIGHSDHTPDLYTSFAAVALGARVLEKHVILDKEQPGPDQSVSIDFSQLAKLVEGVRKIEVSLGTEKLVHDREYEIRKWAFRSIVSTRPIAKGEIISQQMIWSKRPGTGIPAHEMDKVIGCRAATDIPENWLICWQELERD